MERARRKILSRDGNAGMFTLRDWIDMDKGGLLWVKVVDKGKLFSTKI